MGGGAGHLSKGAEQSRRVAASSGAWFRASRVTACRALFLARGTWMEQSCTWMARPRLATCVGRQRVEGESWSERGGQALPGGV